MSKVVLYMSMSVDGFITGPDDAPEHGLGVDGERLHDWLDDGGVQPASHRPADKTNATVFDEMMSTGAVIVGPPDLRLRGRLGRRPPRRRPDLRADPRRTRTSPPPGTPATSPTCAPASAQAKRGRRGRRRDDARRGDGAGVPARRPARRDGAARGTGAAGTGPAAVRRSAARHVELELLRALDGAGRAAPALPRPVGGLSDGEHPTGHDDVARRVRRRAGGQRRRRRWASAGSACSTGSTPPRAGTARPGLRRGDAPPAP